MTEDRRLYIKEFGGSMVAYTVVVLLTRWCVGSDPPPQWILPLALAPIVPIGFAAWAIMRAFRRMDELKRKIHLEALAFSFTGTALACLAYGLLEGTVLPPLGGLWAFMLMMVLRAIGQFIAARRYR